MYSLQCHLSLIYGGLFEMLFLYYVCHRHTTNDKDENSTLMKSAKV